MSYQQTQIAVPPFTPMVKNLVIINVVLWVAIVLVADNLLGFPISTELLGLIPSQVIFNFWLWQPLTYMFLHSASPFHILFNMLILWWFGGELEQRWGSKLFLTYYMVCGVGAGLIYLIGIFIAGLIFGLGTVPMAAPVVGASGAAYGLLLAFGILFGERIIYFMMIFPMKAKFFVMILGAVELVTLVNSGFGNAVANLAHLGGLAAGYLFLISYGQWRKGSSRRAARKHGRRLKLVVDNEKDEDSSKGPKYWH